MFSAAQPEPIDEDKLMRRPFRMPLQPHPHRRNEWYRPDRYDMPWREYDRLHERLEREHNAREDERIRKLKEKLERRTMKWGSKRRLDERMERDRVAKEAEGKKWVNRFGMLEEDDGEGNSGSGETEDQEGIEDTYRDEVKDDADVKHEVEEENEKSAAVGMETVAQKDEKLVTQGITIA